ncbi:MAG: hypothetical protein C0508_04445 [Cyanobacteria bacterium PR.023]|nr:hypothetical protein [Cyanobacteria bacterium PR.023]MDQ5935410.1 periplasmic protein TonB [Cyanobacteriota bacterium erpe_2018_sw_21hr_WHONDRS-SW48-000092_B_bin.40]
MSLARRLCVAIIAYFCAQMIVTNQLVSARPVEGPKTRYCKAVYSLLRKQWQDRRVFDQPVALDLKVDTNGGIDLVSVASASSSPIRENLLGRMEVVDGPKAELSSEDAGRQFLIALRKLPSPSTFSHQSVWLRICLANSATQTSVNFRDVDLESWALDTQQRIRKVWFPPKCIPQDEPMVLFKVDRSGQRSAVRLGRNGRESYADEAALKAVNQSSPFSALPDGSPASIEIRQCFHSSVWGDGRGKFRNF